ncbi:MAG: hypothetical protein ACOVPA_22100 [Rubrivivax sp.]
MHHAQKIQITTNQDFDNVAFAGKSAILLSALSTSQQESLTHEKVKSLAKANGIAQRTELPAILEELAKQKLIERGVSGVEVLGVSSSAVVEHAARIFDESEPAPHEVAAIEVADKVSEQPQREADFLAEMQDSVKLTTSAARDFLATASQIGFFDSEQLSGSEKIYFNGNLFRKDGVRKVRAALDSLTPQERVGLNSLQELLQQHGCVPLEMATTACGELLLRKLQSIGLVDVSSVGNDSGQHHFATSPAAFSKFTNSIADDALDLAKVLVAALTYGMTMSSQGRGRIMALSALMNRLIQGRFVGPATAIGQDYRVLEFKRVIEVRQEANGLFSMRLLKPEVGRLALAVLEEGGVMPGPTPALPGASVSAFTGPERNRVETRHKNVTPQLKSGVASLLDDLRTGAF